MFGRAAFLTLATFVGLFFVPLCRSLGSPKTTTPGSSPVPAPEPSPTSLDAAAHREWQLVAAADGEACRNELVALGMRFRNLPDRAEPDRDGCGIPHGVLVTRGPRGIAYNPPLQIDCSLARELPWIEDVIQKQAEAHLASPIKQITTFGTYSCRRVRGGFTGRLSEHAVGNAIDFGAFVPQRGPSVSVSRDYRPLQDDPGSRGLFLRGVFWDLRAHGGLTHVIGPETRSDHHDHIHVDRGEPWWHFADRLWGRQSSARPSPFPSRSSDLIAISPPPHR